MANEPACLRQVTFELTRHWTAIGIAIAAATVIGCGSAPADGRPAGGAVGSTGAPEREQVAPGQPSGTSVPTQGGFSGGREPAAGNWPSTTTPEGIPVSPDGASVTSAPQPTATNVTERSTGAGKDPLDFSLLSTNGGVVNFNDLRGAVAVGLFFYGGSDCAGCKDRLRDMQESHARFRQIGAELIAISTDRPEKTRMTVDSIGVEFPVLSDVDGTVSQRWGVFNLSGNGHAAPAMFVFNASGDEIGRQVGFTASDLPGLDDLLLTLQRSLEIETARPNPTPAQPPTAPAAMPMQQPSAPVTATPVTTTIVLGPGVTDFRLPDAIGGGEVALSEALRDGNVVLVFYRAFW